MTMKVVYFSIALFWPVLGIISANVEGAFDRAEVFFSQNEFAKAAVYYEESLSEDREGVRGKLGKCYLELALGAKNHEQTQLQYFMKSEQIYLGGLQLDLARLYLIWGTTMRDEHIIEKGRKLISEMGETDYLNLLMASSFSDYATRNSYYLKVTAPTNRSSPYYGRGWFLRGLNELYCQRANLTEAVGAFDLAIQYGVNCRKYKAEALVRQNTREGLLKALSELNLLVQENSGNMGENYYLRGLVAARLFEEGIGEPFGEIAERSFLSGLESYPYGRWAPDSMKALGILYMKRQKSSEAALVFEKLVKTFSTSSEAAEALMWLSVCETGEKGKKYLEQLFTNHPESSLADEAYFRYYSFESYLKEDSESAGHLYQLSAKFPDSDYCVVANYLLGYKSRQQGDLESALEFFQRCGDSPKGRAYFRELSDKASLEKAKILLCMDRTAEAEKVLQSLSSTLVFEESAYLLVKSYLSENSDDAAEQIIDTMFRKYDASNTLEGYYISRFWHERGAIALKQGRPKEALEYFVRAEETAKSIELNADELLDLWIQQSHCYRQLGNLDASMLVLSRVANYNAVSSLRLKAMNLRAEIYEMQGRHELARKQLQAKQKMERDHE